MNFCRWGVNGVAIVALSANALGACGGRLEEAAEPDAGACRAFAYAAGAPVPLYPCGDDPARDDGRGLRTVVVVTDAGPVVTCVCASSGR